MRKERADLPFKGRKTSLTDVARNKCGFFFLSTAKYTPSYIKMNAHSLVILANMKLTVSTAWGRGKSTNHHGNTHFLEAELGLLLSLEMQNKIQT